MDRIKYCAGYKYQLIGDYTIKIEILGVDAGVDKFIKFSPDGTLTIKDGYAWDGPSGPTIDTLDFMRGSLVHDALYQLMREGELPETYRETADKILVTLCKEDGMSPLRAAYVYAAVREFAAGAARVQEKKVIEAP